MRVGCCRRPAGRSRREAVRQLDTCRNRHLSQQTPAATDTCRNRHLSQSTPVATDTCHNRHLSQQAPVTTDNRHSKHKHQPPSAPARAAARPRRAQEASVPPRATANIRRTLITATECARQHAAGANKRSRLRAAATVGRGRFKENHAEWKQTAQVAARA